MLRVSLRLQRTGLIGMTAFGTFYGLIQAGAYNSAAGTTTAQRLAFGQQMEVLGRSLSYLLPIPVRVETASGYLQWRVYGALPILFAFWALMSATGATRGDEGRGLIEQWRAVGVGPLRYLAYRSATFLVTAVVAIAATSAAIYVGALPAKSSLDSLAFIELSIALLGLTLTCYAIGLVAGQLTAARNSASGLGGSVLLLTFFLNSFSRSLDGLKPVAAVLSPFYYYDRSNPLTPGGSFDLTGTAGLFAVAVILATIAAWMMRARDIGSPVLRLQARHGPPTFRPSTNPLLRIAVIAALYEQRVGLLAWGVGGAIGAAFIASIGHQMVDLVRSPTSFRNYLSLVGHGNPYVAITGYFWFGIFQPLIAVYAITAASRWSSDDNEGRLEMVLSAPVSRTRVVAERAIALLVGTAIVTAISSLAFYLSAHSANIDIYAGDLVAASVPLIPFALSFAAVGALMTSRIPRATVPILATLAFASYLVTVAGPLLKWPDWVQKLSVFSLYGTPLTSGIYWTGLWIMLVVTAVGFALAAILMQRRDIGR